MEFKQSDSPMIPGQLSDCDGGGKRIKDDTSIMIGRKERGGNSTKANSSENMAICSLTASTKVSGSRLSQYPCGSVGKKKEAVAALNNHDADLDIESRGPNSRNRLVIPMDSTCESNLESLFYFFKVVEASPILDRKW